MVPIRVADGLCLLLCVAFLAGCGSDSATGPNPVPPVITIEGVTDGTSYDGAVTISISIDRGSYEATLNGQTITSGRTVSEPGAYILVVTARNGLESATRQLSFTIAPPAGGTLIVRLFNLGPNEFGGGGDAILISDSSAAGRAHALIDAGPAGVDGADPGFVSRRLTALGVDTLQFIVLTHAHGDHYQGLPAVLNAVAVRRFYYNGQVRNLSTYQTVLATAQARADSVIIVRDTVPLAFGRAAVQSRFTLIPPIPTFLNSDTNDGTLLNEASVGASLRRGTFSMFFTGDGEYEANRRWRTQYGGYTQNIDVLKVGHHGANNAIFDSGTTGPSTWLDHTAPDIAVISANGITHPRLRALDRLLSGSNRETYCTSVHGEITLRIYSDSRVIVTVEKNAMLNCVRGTQADT